MRYVNKFGEDDLLTIISDNPISTAEVCRQLSCCRSTAVHYLRELEKNGKIKKLLILGSMNYGWVREL